MDHAPTPLSISLATGTSVSALLCAPARASALFVFGHGAGAGMDHPFMAELAGALGQRGVATLRYQFSFMEQGSHRGRASRTPSAPRTSPR